ncbi:MAG: TetR/AcrR family transcriptional regulator [Actinomycetes bacterium]
MTVGPNPEKRETIIEAAYGCIAQFGPTRTSIEDVADAARVSRATMYRYFPGGRGELIDAVVTWEYRRFFLRLYGAVRDAETLEELMERGLMVAHRAIQDHEVLQMILRTEPEALEPAIRAESEPSRTLLVEFLMPYLERHELREGVEPASAADFLARMILSYMGSPGRWDLNNPAEVSRLVRAELLAGILPEVASGR